MQGRRCDDVGRFVRRLVREGALRVGRSFVEKKGKEGRDGGSSIEESGGSTGESREEVRCCGGKSTYTWGRRCAAVGEEVRSCGMARA